VLDAKNKQYKISKTRIVMKGEIVLNKIEFSFSIYEEDNKYHHEEFP
jgi:hypothetical protein